MSFIKRNLLNIPGWRTTRKIVVIESDDWGCVRMPNRKTYNKLVEAEIVNQDNSYNRLDSLETSEDIHALYDVLRSVKDVNGNSAKMTLNTIVANPDFQMIKQDNFLKYHYVPTFSLYNKYNSRNDIVEILNQGINEGLVKPQFHGREHLNINLWLKLLQSNHKPLLIAFDNHVFGIDLKIDGLSRNNVMAAFDYQSISEITEHHEIIKDGLELFDRAFKFKSSSFIAPSYIWNSDLNKTISDKDVNIIQGIMFQFVPNLGKGNYYKKYHFTGQRNKFNQIYLVRNAFFEPSLSQSTNDINECLSRINISFNHMKPAIIGSHRINYMGGIDPMNRHKNLALLKRLLFEIVKKWNDVEFLTTDELGKLIHNLQNNSK